MPTPESIEQRYQGAWRDYVFHATPDRAIAHFRALIEAGIQYFIVETMDAMDHDTIRLLATGRDPGDRDGRQSAKMNCSPTPQRGDQASANPSTLDQGSERGS